jgi:uncharacterized membrane protein YidH (DUF202 family)
MAAGTMFGALILTQDQSASGPRGHALGLVLCAAAVVIGFQLVFNAIFSKVTAVLTGMHPHGAQIDRIIRALTLERGLLIGSSLALVGFGSACAGLLRWSSADVDVTDPSSLMRLVFPAALLLVLGGQIVASCLHLGLLRTQWLYRFSDQEPR